MRSVWLNSRVRVWPRGRRESPLHSRHQHVVHDIGAYSKGSGEAWLPRYAVCMLTAFLPLYRCFRLADNVCLQDLFGRGFSDGVGDLPHDPRLYVTQTLLALASSPIAWTGNDAFRLVGYSLGGGIAVHFANAFPHLVSSLVLLAPAGLIRPESFGITRHIYTSGLVPEVLLSKLTGRRLQQPIAKSKKARAVAEAEVDVKLAEAEIADPADGEPITPLEQRVLMYVRWMVANHSGFVSAFMSSIRHAPLVDQHSSWEKLSQRKPGSTIFLFARSDELIDANDYADVALPLVGGKDHVVWKVLPGGHDFVMTHSKEIVQELDAQWGMQSTS